MAQYRFVPGPVTILSGRFADYPDLLKPNHFLDLQRRGLSLLIEARDVAASKRVVFGP
jgi:hypothetical protein